MRRDILLGLFVSLLVHGGATWISQLLKSPAIHVAPDPEPAVLVFRMPPIEPDPPKAEDQPKDPAPTDLVAPPMLPEVPRPLTQDKFVQPFEPPRPDAGQIDQGIVVIPVNRPGAGAGGDIFEVRLLDEPPKATFQVKPVYPYDLRHRGITGQVVVGFIVDATGTVQHAVALSSTDREFEASAVQAVSHWKFKPGKKDGRAVHTRMQVPIVFSISDS